MHALTRAALALAISLCLTGCGSIISRAVEGQGHNHQYYSGVQWDLRQGYWRYLTVLDLPFSLIVDSLMLPIDAKHGDYK